MLPARFGVPYTIRILVQLHLPWLCHRDWLAKRHGVKKERNDSESEEQDDVESESILLSRRPFVLGHYRDCDIQQG